MFEIKTINHFTRRKQYLHNILHEKQYVQNIFRDKHPGFTRFQLPFTRFMPQLKLSGLYSGYLDISIERHGCKSEGAGGQPFEGGRDHIPFGQLGTMLFLAEGAWPNVHSPGFIEIDWLQ